MNRALLAKKLVSTGNARERSSILARYHALADVGLARNIKQICYEAWAARPTSAQGSAAALFSLFRFTGDSETGALFLWVSGIAEITKGHLESATDRLREASAAFKKLGDEKESASPQVAMLIPLAMLGQYDEALKVGRKALRIFIKYGDDLAVGKVQMNLCNIFARQGLFRRSERIALAALDRFAKVGEATWRTMAENNLANIYTELNDFRKAEQFYERALAGARAASMRVTEAEIEASIGNLALFRGRYDKSLSFLESSRTKYDQLGMPHHSAVADLEIAGIYSELNLIAEAVEIYRRVAKQLARLKMRGEEARARTGLGRASIAAGDLPTARSELKKAFHLFAAEKNRLGSAGVLLMLVKSEIAATRFSAAAGVLEKADRIVKSSGDGRQKLTADWLRSELHFAKGKPAASENRLRSLIARARHLEQTAIEQAAVNLLGKVARDRGDLVEAETNFRYAIDLIETMRAPLPAEEFRIAFFSAKLEPYENLAGVYIVQRKFAEAFECFERSRARALVDAMALDSHGLADAAGAGISVLREELNWFYSRSSHVGKDDKHAFRLEIAKREKALSELSRRVESKRIIKPAGGRCGLPGGALKELQHSLGPDRAFLEYVQIDDRFSVFVVTADRVDFIPNISETADIESLLGGLRFQFDSLRYRPETIDSFETILKMKADKYLERLFEKLLSPTRGLIGNRDLVVSPASILNYLPFHAFRYGERYLTEDREVSYAPSASIWTRTRSKVDSGQAEALIIGFAAENLPQVSREVHDLKALFRKRTVLEGEEATFDSYRRLAPNFDVLHFACHGQFRPDNPSFSSLHLADGWVTVKDICSQQLKASLVTLSACETGVNEIARGEEIIGLARGFLTAGAASIVLSLWTVNDAATASLMKNFYIGLQRGETVVASMRNAQVKMIGEGRHPFFWSPFMVIGR